MYQWSVDTKLTTLSTNVDSQALAAILMTGIFQGLLIPSSLVAATSSSFWFYFYFSTQKFILTL